MARIAGVDIPRDKRALISLTYVFGIGRTRSKSILQEAKIDPEARVKDLTEDEITRIRQIIETNYEVEGDLRRNVNMNLKRLMDIGCYRGLPHVLRCSKSSRNGDVVRRRSHRLPKGVDDLSQCDV